MVLTAQDLSSALGRPVQRTLTKATTVELGPPVDPPAELVNHLRKLLGRDDRIEQAWLALARWPDQENPAWYLDVRTLLSREEVKLILADLFRKADFKGRPLDLLVNPPLDSSTVGIRIAPDRVH